MITKVGQILLNVKPTNSTPARQIFLIPDTWSEGCSPCRFWKHQSPLRDFVSVFMCVCIHICVYTTCNWVLFIHTRGGKQSLNAMPWSNDNANSQLPGKNSLSKENLAQFPNYFTVPKNKTKTATLCQRYKIKWYAIICNCTFSFKKKEKRKNKNA